MYKTLSFTKSFKAPRSLVWEVCTNPYHVKMWWRPFGSENTHSEVVLSEGGSFLVERRNEAGVVHSLHCKIKTYIPQELLVLLGPEDTEKGLVGGFPAGVEMTFAFKSEPTGARLVLTAEFDENARFKASDEPAFTAGWRDKLTGLNSYLKKLKQV